MFDENRSSIGQRVHVLGNSSSGKSTVGLRLSRAPGVPFVELDALNWEPGCLTSTARYKREDDIPLAVFEGAFRVSGGAASRVLTVCRGLRP